MIQGANLLLCCLETPFVTYDSLSHKFWVAKKLRVDTEHIQVYSNILTTFSLSETVLLDLK